MVNPVPESWKRIWEEVDNRVFIMISLSLQIILVWFAPLRKRTANNWLMMALWSVYSLADWAATFALGLISNGLGDFFKKNSRSSELGNNYDLLAFWAPFLLLHLGGPDTITAFALEDNELWLRHLFGLVFECLAAVYIYFQSLPKNKMWIPTLLMFIAGIIKYAERTRSLYYSSLNILRESMLKKPDAGPDYVQIMKSYSSNKEANLPVRIVKVAEPDRGLLKALDRSKKGKLTDLEIVLRAHNFFNTFKGLIVDLTFSSREKTKSREFFSKRSPEDAFKVIEVELNLMYEALFTKFSVVCTGLGYLGRFISFALVVASLTLFYTESKGVFDSIDIAITYILLWGAIALDIIAFLMLVHSDWFLVQIKKLPKVLVEEKARPKRWRRWSKSISQFNVIDYCLHPRSAEKEKFIGYLGLTNFLDSLTYVKEEPFSDELRDHIFQELHAKSELADDLDTAKEITSARGDWVLHIEGKRDFLSYILDFEYDQSLLLWHIATELCYNVEKSEKDPEASPNKYREISKILSDYMIYLLVMQPTTMSAVPGTGEVSFRDTCAEAKRFFTKEGGYQKEQREACEKILGVDTVVDPGTLKGDCKSVLFHGCILAKKLKPLGEGKWELMSKVWIELMSYAAIHCRATTHAQQLRRGGELITHVWLLMTHFGFGYQFPAVPSVYTKIIVGK